MWAVGENRVAIMKFQISNFHCYGVRLLHTFFAQMGPGPLNFFQERGGGGLFNIRGGGASLGQISILKIIIFLMIFLSFFGIFIVCCFIE